MALIEEIRNHIPVIQVSSNFILFMYVVASMLQHHQYVYPFFHFHNTCTAITGLYRVGDTNTQMVAHHIQSYSLWNDTRTRFI